MDYKVGQEIEIVERYMLSRCSGYIAGPAKYSTARIVALDAEFAHLSTGEVIRIATGKLEARSNEGAPQ